MARRLKKDGTEYADKCIRTPLTKKKYLCKDAFQLWIAKERKTREGVSYERISGYYTTYESLFDGYVREQGKKIHGDSIAEQLAELANMEKQIRKMARKVGKELDERELQSLEMDKKV